jgi:hypothetical protein
VESEQSKWITVEVITSNDIRGIKKNPDAKPNSVEINKAQRSGKLRDLVSNSILRSAQAFDVFPTMSFVSNFPMLEIEYSSIFQAVHLVDDAASVAVQMIMRLSCHKRTVVRLFH